MKNILFALIGMLIATTATAQEKGSFNVYDFGNFKLHAYYTHDVMSDASFIIEGEDALVTLEEPLFKDNAAEFDTYVARLGKPVERRIADYHLGGTSNDTLTMVKGMPDFTKGEIYGGMMKGFAQQFGDAIVSMPAGETVEVELGSTLVYAGIPFSFVAGPSNDFPAASILIGGKVFYSHWAPAKAHVNSLQIASRAAIDDQIAALEESLQTGAELFIGSHGEAAGADTVKFMIEYLKTMKETVQENQTAQAFTEAMKKAYPGLPGEAGLEELGKALYK